MQEKVEFALAIVGALSMIAAVTPTPKDDGILFVIKQVLNLFAGNFRHAKTAGDRDVEQQVEAVKGVGAKAGIKKLTELIGN